MIVFLIFSNCTDNKHTTTNEDEIILKVGKFNVSVSEFKEKVANASDYQATPLQLYNRILDSYISAGLLINRAKTEKLDQQAEVIRKINLFKGSLLPAFAKLRRLEKDKQVSDSIAISPQLYNVITTFDYVFIPKNEKALANDLLDRLNSGSSITELIASNKFNEWSRLKLEFYTGLSTASVIFKLDLLDKIGDIKAGAFQLIKTKSGIHLIKVVNRYQAPYPLQNKSAIALNVRTAEAIAAGDSLLNRRTLEASLKINDELFSDITFEIEPLTTVGSDNSDPVIGNFLGQDIRASQLMAQISKFPVKIQSYFKNKSTRSLEITNLILVNNAQLYNKRLQMIKDRSTQLTDFFSKALKRSGSKDTLSFLVKTIEDALKPPVGANSAGGRSDLGGRALPFLLNETDGMTKTSPIPLFKVGDFSWIYNENLPGKEMMKLNFAEINKMDFARNRAQFDNSDIAYCKGWHLTVNQLRHTIEQLTPQTRLIITKRNGLIKLIYYLKNNSQPTSSDSKVILNQQLLGDIDIIGDALDKVNSYKENDILGSMANIKLTEVQARNLISDLPEEDRKQYLTDEFFRKEAFKQLLVNEFWKTKINKGTFQKDVVFNRKLQRYENWVLSNQFYKSRIMVSAPETTNEFINIQLRLACQMVTEKRLSAFLQKEAAVTNIEVNTRLLKAIGGGAVKSGYRFSVINN